MCSQKIVQTIAQFMPDKEPDPFMHKHGYVGKPINRVDGQLKVKGEARFTAEFKSENLAHAALVHRTIAKGRAVRIDASEAEKVPGLIAVITHENMPKTNAPALLDVTDSSKGFAASELPVLQDNKVIGTDSPWRSSSPKRSTRRNMPRRLSASNTKPKRRPFRLML